MELTALTIREAADLLKQRQISPVDLTRACLDERIEAGTIDFVDDLANIVPAIMTLALMALPLVDWVIYCEPAHATVYTPPQSADIPSASAARLSPSTRLLTSFILAALPLPPV